ncbi:MAG: hypothetical protein BMS9Abin05_0983 [Rhodothermia bacterium]|nr:MAG: hypothetical protein BMS9Abin05_0983 [Rhodothermia bacterium]
MTASQRVYQIKVGLRHSQPAIWRRLLVRDTISLLDFHDLLQFAMGWEDCHMHQFVKEKSQSGRRRPEMSEIRNEEKTMLKDVLRKPNDRILYEYDFGDGWLHDIVLEEVLDADPNGKYPWFLAGKRACPPEDCGGVGGYYHLLDVLGDSDDPEYVELSEWLGEGFDPEAFDAEEKNRRIHGKNCPPGQTADISETTSAEEEYDFVESPLRREVEKDGYVLDVQIYGSGKDDWILEVVNEEGTSILWDGTFDTDHLAWAEFEKCLKEEGIEAFM